MFIGVGQQEYEPMLHVGFLTASHCADKYDQSDVSLFMNSSRVESGEMFGPYEWTAEGKNYITTPTLLFISCSLDN